MAILNYTTKVPVGRTVAEIHKILVKAGASAIMNGYSPSGQICEIQFRVTTKTMGEVFYTLPADVDGVSSALKKDRVYRDQEHAERVAWRIVKDWVEAQMAIIEAQMAELPQVFLPYAKTSNGQTVYQRISESGLLLLEKKV